MSAWEEILLFKEVQEAVGMTFLSSHCWLIPYNFLSAYSQATEKLIKSISA